MPDLIDQIHAEAQGTTGAPAQSQQGKAVGDLIDQIHNEAHGQKGTHFDWSEMISNLPHSIWSYAQHTLPFGASSDSTTPTGVDPETYWKTFRTAEESKDPKEKQAAKDQIEKWTTPSGRFSQSHPDVAKSHPQFAHAADSVEELYHNVTNPKEFFAKDPVGAAQTYGNLVRVVMNPFAAEQLAKMDAATGGALKGAYQGAMEPTGVYIPRLRLHGIEKAPAVLAGGLTGAATGEFLGWPLGEAKAGAIIGGVTGAAGPIIRGAVQGAKEALAGPEYITPSREAVNPFETPEAVSVPPRVTPARALGPGGFVMEPPPDVSGVNVTTGEPLSYGGPRQLPPPQVPATGVTPVARQLGPATQIQVESAIQPRDIPGQDVGRPIGQPAPGPGAEQNPVTVTTEKPAETEAATTKSAAKPKAEAKTATETKPATKAQPIATESKGPDAEPYVQKVAKEEDMPASDVRDILKANDSVTPDTEPKLSLHNQLYGEGRRVGILPKTGTVTKELYKPLRDEVSKIIGKKLDSLKLKPDEGVGPTIEELQKAIEELKTRPTVPAAKPAPSAENVGNLKAKGATADAQALKDELEK